MGLKEFWIFKNVNFVFSPIVPIFHIGVTNLLQLESSWIQCVVEIPRPLFNRPLQKPPVQRWDCHSRYICRFQTGCPGECIGW